MGRLFGGARCVRLPPPPRRAGWGHPAWALAHTPPPLGEPTGAQAPFTRRVGCSLRSALAALGARCARCVRRSLRSLRSALAALSALGAHCARCARRSLRATLFFATHLSGADASPSVAAGVVSSGPVRVALAATALALATLSAIAPEPSAGSPGAVPRALGATCARATSSSSTGSLCSTAWA